MKNYKKLYEQNQEHYNDLQKQRLEDYILNDRLKKDVDLLFSTIEHQVNKLNDRINNYEHDINLPNIINDLHKKNNKLNDKIESLTKLGYNKDTNDPPNIYKSLALQINDLSNKIDDLEAKNYQLKSELDGIYKVLEMDACDIQELQDKMEDK